ncbi:MAG TPA: hypothetical protein VF298_03850, partial [Bacteroidales bacterium]
VPIGSKAGDFFYDGKEGFNASKIINASCWFKVKHQEDQQRLFNEYCFSMKSINQVTSVIWEVIL